VTDFSRQKIDLIDATSLEVVRSCDLCCNLRVAGAGYSAGSDILMVNYREPGTTALIDAEDCSLTAEFVTPGGGWNNGFGAAIRETTRSGFITKSDNEMVYELDLSGVVGEVVFDYWVPVVSRGSGSQGSMWQSDLALLNRNPDAANLSLTFFVTTGPPVSETTSVGPWCQRVFEDVVSVFGANGSGALRIESDRPLRITSRTYNVGSEGTFGQSLGCVESDGGLAAGGRAWITQLSQLPNVRSNIGFTNLGSRDATVQVALYLANGSSVGTFWVVIPPGGWVQENQPFLVRFGSNNVAGGYAEVQVLEGFGVVAYGSVIDSRTNDPTTIPMQR
jgi:hypothetical protein